MHGDLCKHLGIDSSTDHPDRVLESIPKCLHKSPSACRILILPVYKCSDGIPILVRLPVSSSIWQEHSFASVYIHKQSVSLTLYYKFLGWKSPPVTTEVQPDT